jgi:DNA-binding GntR family transcriptional regulator
MEMALAVGPDAVTFEKLGLVIDNHSFVPYYVQIVDRVRDLVKKNKLREGQTFCSEGEIAQALGISKMPVRQAFQKLRAEGLLVIAKGKRPVVGSGRVPWNFQQLRGFSEEMRRRGLNPSAQLLSITGHRGTDLPCPAVAFSEWRAGSPGYELSSRPHFCGN